MGLVAAIGLLLTGMPVPLSYQQHVGDPLQINRELRKFRIRSLCR